MLKIKVFSFAFFLRVKVTHPVSEFKRKPNNYCLYGGEIFLWILKVKRRWSYVPLSFNLIQFISVICSK